MSAPLTPEERQHIKDKLALGGGGIPLSEGYEVVMRLLATVDALEAAGERLDQSLNGMWQWQSTVQELVPDELCEQVYSTRAAWRQAKDAAGQGKG